MATSIFHHRSFCQRSATRMDGISGDRFLRPSPRIEFEKKTIIENKGKGMIDRNILRISRDGIRKTCAIMHDDRDNRNTEFLLKSVNG